MTDLGAALPDPAPTGATTGATTAVTGATTVGGIAATASTTVWTGAGTAATIVSTGAITAGMAATTSVTGGRTAATTGGRAATTVSTGAITAGGATTGPAGEGSAATTVSTTGAMVAGGGVAATAVSTVAMGDVGDATAAMPASAVMPAGAALMLAMADARTMVAVLVSTDASMTPEAGAKAGGAVIGMLPDDASTSPVPTVDSAVSIEPISDSAPPSAGADGFTRPRSPTPATRMPPDVSQADKASRLGPSSHNGEKRSRANTMIRLPPVRRMRRRFDQATPGGLGAA